MTEKRIDLTRAIAVDNYWYFFQLAAASNDLFSAMQAMSAVESSKELIPVVNNAVRAYLIGVLQSHLSTAMTNFVYGIDPGNRKAERPVRAWIRARPGLNSAFEDLRKTIDSDEYSSFKMIRHGLIFHYAVDKDDTLTKTALVAMAAKWEELGRHPNAGLDLVLLHDSDLLLKRYVVADWMRSFMWAPMMGADSNKGPAETQVFELSRALLSKFSTFADAAFDMWSKDNDLWIN